MKSCHLKASCPFCQWKGVATVLLYCTKRLRLLTCGRWGMYGFSMRRPLRPRPTREPGMCSPMCRCKPDRSTDPDTRDGAWFWRGCRTASVWSRARRLRRGAGRDRPGCLQGTRVAAAVAPAGGGRAAKAIAGEAPAHARTHGARARGGAARAFGRGAQASSLSQTAASGALAVLDCIPPRGRGAVRPRARGESPDCVYTCTPLAKVTTHARAGT